ncbi:hypothetical protein NDA03_09310 [Trichocoleus sp. Lan]|uniref:hypothetical protein n=1 Tax=unclassified Trichocoleus TaxID=2628910 RepID=UPI003296FB27
MNCCHFEQQLSFTGSSDKLIDSQEFICFGRYIPVCPANLSVKRRDRWNLYTQR